MNEKKRPYVIAAKLLFRSTHLTCLLQEGTFRPDHECDAYYDKFTVEEAHAEIEKLKSCPKVRRTFGGDCVRFSILKENEEFSLEGTAEKTTESIW